MIILGIDEVGRGPWAGPLVIGAVVLNGIEIEGLTDSKKLTAKKRELLNEEILKSPATTALGWVSSEELDGLGLSESLRLATRRAVEKISVPYNEIIIDGTINFLSGTKKAPYVTTLKKADLLIPEVSAASIIAKVARDNYMKSLAKKYPNHAFENHVGYGTAAHKNAIETYGLTPEHRLSFRPITEIAEGMENGDPRRAIWVARGRGTPEKNFGSGKFFRGRNSRQAPNTQATSHFPPRTITAEATPYVSAGAPSANRAHTTKQLGDRAESIVTNFLIENNHTIIARNWKTRMCEIDIISLKSDEIFFTEVKYRKNPAHGSALEAITKTKLNQMSFAAESFLKAKNLSNLSPKLAVASLSGPSFTLDNWLLLD